MRLIKFEILFTIHNRDFTKSIGRTYTTLDMLIDGNDDTNYDDIDIIAKRQFTGLKDCNGVDIYEGDVLDFCEREWGGMFTPEAISFGDITGKWDLCGSVSDVSEWRSIIGNIHENPELIKGER